MMLRSWLAASIVAVCTSGCMLEIPEPPADHGSSSCKRCSDDETCTGVWLSRGEIAALPIAGEPACDSRCTLAWQALLEASAQNTPPPDLADANDPASPYVLAKALVSVKLDDASLRDQVRAAIADAIPTTPPLPSDSFPFSSHLALYVISADLIGLSTLDASFYDGTFVPWLEDARTRKFTGGGTLIETAQTRPTHAGTNAAAASAAIAALLGDDATLATVEVIERGWLGDRSQATSFGFSSSAETWMVDPSAPVPVNPKGAVIQGHNVDGVVVDSMPGNFVWPPEYSIDVYNALSGATLAVMILDRRGRDPWTWSDSALRRAAEWMVQSADGKPSFDTSDDRSKSHVLDLIDWAYATSLALPEPSEPGRAIAWTSWTHAACR